MITEVSRNSHILDLPKKVREAKFLLISDPHWDNPKCDRSALKRHLDQAKKENCPVFINGDLFCVMQGKYDPRRSKKDIRPEHNVANYIDAVIEDAANWFKPYADIIAVVGVGNHESAILKNLETDMTERFVERLNTISKAKNKVHKGGYGGWITTRFNLADKGNTLTHKIKYHHGYGGGGPVTKGTIQHNRFSTYVEGADLIWFGHVHEDYETTYCKEYLDKSYNPVQKDVLMVRTSTYKEEYGDGSGGFHIEKGRPVKPIGGRWLKLSIITRDNKTQVFARTEKTQ